MQFARVFILRAEKENGYSDFALILGPVLAWAKSAYSGMMPGYQDTVVRQVDPNRGHILTWKLKPVGVPGQPFVIYTP